MSSHRPDPLEPEPARLAAGPTPVTSRRCERPVSERPLAERPARVLLTGGAGFIGAALVRALLARGAALVVLDDFSAGFSERLPAHSRLAVHELDVAAPGALAGLVADSEPFDHLVHLAARVGVRTVLADPEGCRRENERGAAELVRALERLAPADRPRLWAASTSEVYATRRAPLDEDAPLRAARGTGRWAYAGSKLAAERLFDGARALWPAAGARVDRRGPVHLRFFNVVGPGQCAEQGMVLARFVERAAAGLPLEVHGDGRQERTLAHVDDVARVLAELLVAPAASVPAGPLNVGGTAGTTIGALAELVARRAPGGPVAIAHVDPRASLGARFEEIPWRAPDLARLAGLGVGVPDRSVEAIVADTCARHAALARPTARVCGADARGTVAESTKRPLAEVPRSRGAGPWALGAAPLEPRRAAGELAEGAGACASPGC